MKYYNYHKHDHKGNIRSMDVIVKLEDYCKRAIELGHDAIFTTNHGFQGDVFEAKALADKYGLKLIIGAELYYVENRLEKDKSNKHIIVIAMNDDGVRDLNRILSSANVDGFYYKPRVDRELIMSLNPNNVIITTACVAGVLKNTSLIMDLHNKFKSNFFLEVQNHDEDLQKEFNTLALELSDKLGIRIIHANDSHYIHKDESKYRTLFLNGKGIIYSEETEFILDYPTYDEIVERYKKQGVLNEEQIHKALENTLVFENASNLTIINDDIKLPSISDNPNLELKTILFKEWQKERSNVDQNRIDEYEDAIRYEMDIIEKTKMEDYFILDYKIVERAKEVYDGMLTKTGRGSAPSFYVNKLLGLTDMDRLDAPVPLFPTRFMSVERILGARSLPDIDLNASDREPFIQATKDILGEENCAWMIAFKPLQDASAFRFWCKANGYELSEYDDIAKNIDSYRKHTRWGKVIEDSKVFVGVVESVSESPCSMVLYNKPIAEEIGLIKTEGRICCILDGYNCDKYKYLKNDYLKVTVWELIRETCKLANIDIPTIREFTDILDDKTFDIYRKGLTCTINQADSDWATNLVRAYKPKTLAEVSAFVAGIRPGFASLLSNFIERKSYSTGVQALDKLLEDSYHYLMYQESIMKYLIWLGIDEPSSYDVIKKIAKKKFKEQELIELHGKLEKGWLNNVGTMQGFEETWQVVEDASRYSFNASHSLAYAFDSLYGAYLKSHYPLEYYTVAFNIYNDDMKRTTKLTEELAYFGIELKPPKFRYSKGSYSHDKETNSIYKGIGSIKYLNSIIGEELYNRKNKYYYDFIDVLVDLTENTSANSRAIGILINLNFFEEFGKSGLLHDIYEAFQKRYKKTYVEKTKVARLYELREYSLTLENKELPISTIINAQLEYVGHIDYINKEYQPNVVLITNIKTNKFGTPFFTMYRIYDGATTTIKVNKQSYLDTAPKIYDVIQILEIISKPKTYKDEMGKWVRTDEHEQILTSYRKVVM